jgi:hypothetical protein
MKKEWNRNGIQQTFKYVDGFILSKTINSIKRESILDLLLRNDFVTNNETTSAARQQILNKQVYEAVTA